MRVYADLLVGGTYALGIWAAGLSYDVWTCQQWWWLVQLQLSAILPVQSLMYSHKWMIKGRSGVVWSGRACCLCVATPDPVCLLEWCCTLWDILHDPLKAPGVVDPCPWMWHPQCCLCWPCFYGLHPARPVRALPALNFPAYSILTI